MGGDSSTNIQAQGDITIGLGYSDVKEIAMDVFRANFIELKSVAAQVAIERAESFLDSYFKRAAQEGQVAIQEAENPDFQYVLFSAQKEFARTGDEDLGDLLVQLLVERTKERDRDLKQIVLNESLTVAPKLTAAQLDTLTLIFVLANTANVGMDGLSEFHESLDTEVLPFISGATKKQSGYQHLVYAGCGSYELGIRSGNLAQAYSSKYPGLFCEGFTEDELETIGLTPEIKAELIIPCLHNPSLLQAKPPDNQTMDDACSRMGVEPEKAEKLKALQAQKVISDDKVKDYLVSVRPYMKDLFEAWDNTPMGIMTLTSVGIAIGNANAERRVGSDFADLSIWIES